MVTGPTSAGPSDLREALARSEEQAWHTFVAHTAHQLSRTLAAQGAPGDAEEALAVARAVPLAERLGIVLPRA
ncbi:MAG: hypothetical protein ACTHQ3_07935 [Motilibacteraceae bacterium]